MERRPSANAFNAVTDIIRCKRREDVLILIPVGTCVWCARMANGFGKQAKQTMHGKGQQKQKTGKKKTATESFTGNGLQWVVCVCVCARVGEWWTLNNDVLYQFNRWRDSKIYYWDAIKQNFVIRFIFSYLYTSERAHCTQHHIWSNRALCAWPDHQSSSASFRCHCRCCCRWRWMLKWCGGQHKSGCMWYTLIHVVKNRGN